VSTTLFLIAGCFLWVKEDCVVRDLKMEFDLVSFTLAPTFEVFNRCKKKELIQIAEFFNVLIVKEATKQVIKETLYDKLLSDGILASQSYESKEEEQLEAVEGKGVDSVGPLDTDSMAFQDPRFSSEVKGVRVGNKEAGV